LSGWNAPSLHRLPAFTGRLEASTKSVSGEQASQFEANVRSVYKQMARIAIEPRWARYYDFTARRVPEFLLRLVNESSAIIDR
jgi:hypothetical protein